MSALVECIESLQPKLDKHRNTDLKETPTRTIFIDPLLLALGWDVRNWDDVQLEYPTIDGKSVDYAAKINDKAVLLIEAKSLDDPLTDVRAITQVVGYAANDGIEWCILTNGAKYKVYCTREKGAAPEKLLFEVSLDPTGNNGMTNQQVAECFLRFSKDAIANGILDKLGEDIFNKGKVSKALNKILHDPPKSLIRELRKVIADDSIKPSQVQKIIGELWTEKNKIQIPIPSVPGTPVFPEEVKKKIKPEVESSFSEDKSLLDTIVVPAQEEGFRDVFMKENRWHEIRIRSSMLPRIKYIAAYQVAPISAITHLAEVKDIKLWPDSEKYVVNFTGPAKEIKHITLMPKGKIKAPQAPRYANFSKLQNAKTFDDVF
jgi:hypothetical protein